MKHLLAQKAHDEEVEEFDPLRGGFGIVLLALGTSVLTGISAGLISAIAYIVFVQLTGILR